MAPTGQAKSADKKPRRRGASQSPKTKVVKGEAKDESSFKSGIQTSVSADSLIKVHTSPLEDPAVIATARPLTETTKANTASSEKKDGDKASPSNRKKRSDRGSPTVPKAPRAMRRGAASQTKKQEDVKVENKASTVASKIAAFEHKGSAPAVSSNTRRDSIKSKRDGVLVKASQESLEEKKSTVRFQTEAVPKATTYEKPTDRKVLASETLAQQAAIQDAAAMLAQNPLAAMANNPLYANLLATNLAQQQIATAQVLANLRASVTGFRPMKNYESPSAYDASCVPCLSNREDINTTTNIYVNNLPAHTTDDDLLRLGTCFGPVKSHKAIINQETGLCKGYGFVMYESPRDAETALQQLPLHGLTTSWAKESFSTKLRKLSDNCSTNVYISNLPLDMTPHQLEQLFAPHFVVSLRILLDDSGTSRGVGFVRLRDREIAQDCIDKLHGKILPGQTSPLQARFADSEAQKRLKQTANTTGNDAKNTTSINKSTSGLLDPTGGLIDPMYLASLQGLQNWTGFGTPQNPSAAAFASPQLDMTSPALNYAQFSPNLTASNNINWTHLMNTADMYGTNFFNSPGAGMLGLNYQNSLYSPNSMASSLTSPMAQMSNKSLSPLSFISTPMSDASPMTGKFDGMQKRMGSDRMKPTYLPAEVHRQHAKALLEAQNRLAFGMTPMEGCDLFQESKSLEGQDAMMNALGMTGVTAMGPAPQKQMKSVHLTNAKEADDLGKKSNIGTKDDAPIEKGKLTPRLSKESEVGTTSISLTEDGDSLVIDSGSAASVDRFSDQPEKTSVNQEEICGMTKSDSGKAFNLEEGEGKAEIHHAKEAALEQVTSPDQLIGA